MDRAGQPPAPKGLFDREITVGEAFSSANSCGIARLCSAEPCRYFYLAAGFVLARSDLRHRIGGPFGAGRVVLCGRLRRLESSSICDAVVSVEKR